MFSSFLSILLLLVAAQSTNNTAGTYGCLESSSTTALSGNYTLYSIWSNHSIWIKQTIGETYVIYFDESLGAQMYHAFGIYKCDNSDIYTDTVDQMTVKSPSGVMGCAGTPIIFCPALDDNNLQILSDGMGASAIKESDWLYIKDFFSCGTWFNYIDDSMYPTTAGSITFNEDTWCSSSSSGNNGNNGGSGSGAGGTTHIGSDGESKAKMSATAQAILWSAVSIFMIICIVAISYYVYKWREKKLLSEEQNVGLTEEKEENKFENDSGLIGDGDEDNTIKDVAV